MDSRLLNLFHDDPFDGSYTQLNTDYWSSESDTMGQLTETLNGILPIAPDAEHNTDGYNTMLATEDNFRIANKIDAATNLQNKELLFYDDYLEHQLPTDGGIEIITVDPNSLNSDSDGETTDDTNDGDNNDVEGDHEIIGMNYDEFVDNHSQYSNATFRTRTDSSSIGDYESHTSDYDDSSDEEDMVDNVANNQLDNMNIAARTDELLLDADDLPDLTAGLLNGEGIDLNASFQLHLDDIAAGSTNRRLSTNTILDVDVNNFDLTEFIINDDLAINVPNEDIKTTSIEQPREVAVTKAITIHNARNIDSDSDSDSDVIVDIETVDTDMDKSFWNMASETAETSNDNAVNDVTYEDNVKKDPSWSPKPTKKQDTAVKEAKTRSPAVQPASIHNSTNTQNTRNFTIIPNKRQCDILKGKTSSSKAKLLSKQTQCKVTTKKGPETTAGNAPKPGALTCRVGVGQGGKNLALLSQSISTTSANDTKSQSDETSESDGRTPEKLQATIPNQEIEDMKKKEETMAQAKHLVKRKLNLEEYKRRRGNTNTSAHTDGVKGQREGHNLNKTIIQSTPVKHSPEVTSVVNNLKKQVIQKQPIDPITEAKNKVLRMKELKRAQQLKIIDSTISAKVPRVTKLPPLKDIVKDTYNVDKDQHNQSSSRLHPDYEEVIIVSAGSNTDISIPPLNIIPSNTCERSLLKSSALLYKMSNTINSNNSLIASIQDVVQNVVLPDKSNITNVGTIPVTSKTQKGAEQHGEDKVIMHLRKDRIRPHTVSIGIQTELQPGFPGLPKIPLKPHAERNYRKVSGNKSAKDDSESDASCERSRQYKRSHISGNRSRSRSADSYTSSTEHACSVRQSDVAGGYSSRSSRRHRSSISSSYSESGRLSRKAQRQSRTSYKKRTKKYARNSSVSSSSSSDCHLSDHSRNRSRSRSRSRSPYYRHSYSKSPSRSRSISHASNRFRKSGGHKNNVSQPAVEERRIVYVGRIEEETTKEILKRKFSPYGTIKQISIHYKDTGMKYGFVTYERSQDAFTVIDSSARDPTINMYDISFGGRRAFCRSSYADLDNAGINTYHSIVFPKVEAPPKEEDSFEALLQKMKAKMNAKKLGAGSSATKA